MFEIMDTPICDFINGYIKSGVSRLHMPGHKGVPFLGFEKYDLTEIKGADSLYEASGVIARSEGNASRLFGTEHSFYSTEGSSLCVKAMLHTAMINAVPFEGRPVVLAARNVHKSFIHACALLDIDAEWLYPESGSYICSCSVSCAELEEKLGSMAAPPIAVYITSPDYLGGISDISGISRVCVRHGVPLIVDNAHGAYLKFLRESLHPIDLGADMCCDSAHKTLPVLTGGAYLHVSKSAPEGFARTARGSMALFASTSPSYLILQSLDLCNRYIHEGYAARLEGCAGNLDRLKAAIRENGCAVRDTEPLKLVIDAGKTGMSGTALADVLRANMVECEYSDSENVVMMFTPENTQTDYIRAAAALSGLSAGSSAAAGTQASLRKAEKAMTIREAVFKKHETVAPQAAIGRVCASPAVSCPPAVPIAVSGEVITKEAAEFFVKHGIKEVEVVLA